MSVKVGTLVRTVSTVGRLAKSEVPFLRPMESLLGRVGIVNDVSRGATRLSIYFGKKYENGWLWDAKWVKKADETKIDAMSVKKLRKEFAKMYSRRD